MSDTLAIGQRIRNFRKRAGMSQLDLELELGSGEGSISRIENGRVNPGKETILAIAQILDLSNSEVADLMGVLPLFPTEEEINAAVAEMQDYLNDETKLAYLLDEWTQLFAVSKGFIGILQLTPEQLGSLVGKSLYEVVLDPQYGVDQLMDQESAAYTLAIELARTQREVDFENSDIFTRLQKLPQFNAIWELSKNVTEEELFSPQSKSVYFNIGGEKKQMHFWRERLKRNPRFEIIEYA